MSHPFLAHIRSKLSRDKDIQKIKDDWNKNKASITITCGQGLYVFQYLLFLKLLLHFMSGSWSSSSWTYINWCQENILIHIRSSFNYRRSNVKSPGSEVTYLDRLLERDSDFAEDGDLSFKRFHTLTQFQTRECMINKHPKNGHWICSRVNIKLFKLIIPTCLWRGAACHVTWGHYLQIWEKFNSTFDTFPLSNSGK